MTELSADRKEAYAPAVTTADKSRIRSFLIEEDLEEIQEAISEGAELSENEEEVLSRINTRLLNIQRTVSELKQNIT